MTKYSLDESTCRNVKCIVLYVCMNRYCTMNDRNFYFIPSLMVSGCE